MMDMKVKNKKIITFHEALDIIESFPEMNIAI